MKKKLWKSTFVVAIALTTCIASGITYAHSPSALLSAAEFLMEENMLAFSEGYNTEPVYGPALKIIHQKETLVDHVNTLAAFEDFNNKYSSNVASQKYQEVCQITNCMRQTDVPSEYHKYVTFKDPTYYYYGERQEYLLDGKYDNCTSFGLTTLPDSRKPLAMTYFTEESYFAQF